MEDREEMNQFHPNLHTTLLVLILLSSWASMIMLAIILARKINSNMTLSQFNAILSPKVDALEVAAKTAEEAIVPDPAAESAANALFARIDKVTSDLVAAVPAAPAGNTPLQPLPGSGTNPPTGGQS
jgi:hypothetical protein